MHLNECKSCGGELSRIGNYYVCKFCGNKWMIDADNDVHVIDRANAWAALRDCDFERAVELFENIIFKEPENHEAYWGRALANAGIMYVTDLDENKKVPTCNSISEYVFDESRDVQRAIALAPKDIADTYKKQAEQIEGIRVEWLEKARKEKPYDVFICFKDSDREHNIERTDDSYDAHELYNALTAEGYRVFFSRVSLRGKISEHFEPYIYNALKTAKVMIVLGEKAEYFNAVWVKNEWTRFRAMIARGEKAKESLVVVYKNIIPDYLPAGLRSRQCLNASEMTFLDTLKRHIDKIINAPNPQSELAPELPKKSLKPPKKSKKGLAIAAAAFALALSITVGFVASSLLNGSDKMEPIVTEQTTERAGSVSESTEADKDNGKETEKQTERATDVYGENSFTSSFPKGELDFDGAEVAILFRDHVQNSREWKKEATEDELDEAIAMRNEKVQEELNVKIVWCPVASNGNNYTEYTERFYEMVQIDVNNGIHSYDISANFGYATTSLYIRDYTTNLLNSSLFPYFNFKLPCWNQSIVNNTTFNGRLHYVAGDINLSMFDASCVVWHNKTLYDAKKADTDPDNLLQHALDGNWIYDDLYRWAQAFYEDTGKTANARDDGDTYGLLAATSTDAPMPRDAFPYAWDLEFVIENNDGTHKFNIVGNNKIATALSNCRKLLRADGTYNSSSAHMFAAGKAIFFMERLYSGYDANMAIREMEDKYGLLPMPKYDGDQKEYYTTAQDYYTLMFVLDHSESKVPTKGDEVSAFLQLATEESYTGVRGYYFNRIIKPKFFGIDDSEGTVTRSLAIFDIIVSKIRFDYCYIYSQSLNDINFLWRDATSEGKNDTLEKTYLADRSAFEDAIMYTDAWLGLG